MSSILDNLPSIIKMNNDDNKVSQDDVKSVNKDDNKQFIVIYDRKPKQEDINLLSVYGKVLQWNSSYVNIPLDKHQFDYLIVDVSNKEHRNLLMKENMEKYNIIVLCEWYSEVDDYVEDVKADNVLHGLPPQQAFKADFDRLLLSKKIRKPSCGKVILRLFKKLLNAWD